MDQETSYSTTQKITGHLAEFWNEIGKTAEILQQHECFMVIQPEGNSWPSKNFAVKPSSNAINKLKSGILDKQFPNSILAQSDQLKALLESSGFKLVSSLKAMYSNVSGSNMKKLDETQFEVVTTKQQAKDFARIAATSFDYPVMATTITALLGNPNFQMVLGKHKGVTGSCGMLYLDKNGVCGFHMIGTMPNFRGMGMGKNMTQFLLNKALELDFGKIYLVASKSGEPIYSKMGFISFGNVETYAWESE